MKRVLHVLVNNESGQVLLTYISKSVAMLHVGGLTSRYQAVHKPIYSLSHHVTDEHNQK